MSFLNCAIWHLIILAVACVHSCLLSSLTGRYRAPRSEDDEDENVNPFNADAFRPRAYGSLQHPRHDDYYDVVETGHPNRYKMLRPLNPNAPHHLEKKEYRRQLALSHGGKTELINLTISTYSHPIHIKIKATPHANLEPESNDENANYNNYNLNNKISGKVKKFKKSYNSLNVFQDDAPKIFDFQPKKPLNKFMSDIYLQPQMVTEPNLHDLDKKYRSTLIIEKNMVPKMVGIRSKSAFLPRPDS